ncbi:MAG TPA: choice-of-anchor D domain-containing protein, partial [Candidatus Hydrogenedentes bacterium]|nr:choice-of-anchor D domain-containing protein [Candidatus Hydrogenedentota bacterium]
ELAKTGATRITMTSAGMGPIDGLALFDAHGISFSHAFWGEIMQGSSYGQAFDVAKTAMEAVNPLQMPQIDDNGNGIANEATDGLIAMGVYAGAGFDAAGGGVFIGAVADAQATDTDSATLWLADVVADLPVKAAGVLIVAPNFRRPESTDDDEQPLTGLEWVNLGYNAERDRWEGVYSGFTEGGLFRVQYYVNSGGRYYASPRVGYVERVGIADAWEDDDTAYYASWIPVNSVQGHNFHDEGDEDWLRFTSPQDLMATIAVVSCGDRCQPVLDLYRQADLDEDPDAPPVQSAAAERYGQEVILQRHFVTPEQYVLRIANADETAYGAGTSYVVIVAVETGTDLIPTTLIVSVVEAGKGLPIPQASVVFNSSATSKTSYDGVVHFICPSYGNYGIAASKTGYISSSSTVRVNNVIEHKTQTLEKHGPEIQVTPSSYNFGTVAVGHSSDTVLTVKNTGVGTLEGQATVAEPFRIVSGGTYSLGAGQQQSVTVRFAPTASGNFSKNVTFTGGDGASCALSGRGEAQPGISVSPITWDFGSVEVGQTADKVITVENSGGGTLAGEATVAAPFSIVSGGTYSLGAGQEQAVTVRFAPTTPGNYAEQVSFTGGGGATCNLSGHGEAPPAIAVTPTAWDFGTVEVGQSADKAITVQNTGGGM